MTEPIPVTPRDVSEASRPSTLMVRLKARLATESRLASTFVCCPHPALLTLRQGKLFVVVVPASVWDGAREVIRPFAEKLAGGEAMIVVLGQPRSTDLAQAINRGIGALLPRNPSDDELFIAIYGIFDRLEARARAESRGHWLSRYRYELGELIDIAKALTGEREIDTLLNLILEKSRFITGADAGSLYVVEGDDPDLRKRTLRFKLSQNASVAFDSREFTIPLSPRSISGYVALHKRTLNIADVYDLPASSPFDVDRSFDAKIGYRTCSMLCAPLLSRVGDVVGVIQLINKKRDPQKRLMSPEDVLDQVIPFDERSEQLLTTLSFQAGIALENATLYAEIQNMLEGFVRASVEAIEQRDPTTSGHSRRVAGLTRALARAVEQVGSGPYREVCFSADDLRELEYASLLHDFGKIGVREEVLLKAKKLFPAQLAAIRSRIDLAIRSVEVDILSRKVRLLERGGTPSGFNLLDDELARRKREFEAAFELVCAANEPTVLTSGQFDRIEALGVETFIDVDGKARPLLLADEIASLSVARGSLTSTEIEEIRNHVTHTFSFLSQIPWGKQFRRVAAIAGAHHERLNGTGYPNRLHAAEIPLQSKMMSVSDIFDALTASDRPYKKAVPLERALDILGLEARDQHVDGELLRIFIEARVWTSVGTFEPPSLR